MFGLGYLLELSLNLGRQAECHSHTIIVSKWFIEPEGSVGAEPLAGNLTPTDEP
jgi:hypothetical protein